MIAQGGRHDLGAGSAVLVDQNNQLKVDAGASGTIIEDFFIAFAVDLTQDHTLVDELAGRVDRRAEQTSGISAHVDDELFQARVSRAVE